MSAAELRWPLREVGALLVSWGKTSFSESRPDDWIYLQGLLFVVVVALHARLYRLRMSRLIWLIVNPHSGGGRGLLRLGGDADHSGSWSVASVKTTYAGTSDHGKRRTAA